MGPDSSTEYEVSAPSASASASASSSSPQTWLNYAKVRKQSNGVSNSRGRSTTLLVPMPYTSTDITRLRRRKELTEIEKEMNFLSRLGVE